MKLHEKCDDIMLYNQEYFIYVIRKTNMFAFKMSLSHDSSLIRTRDMAIQSLGMYDLDLSTLFPRVKSELPKPCFIGESKSFLSCLTAY